MNEGQPPRTVKFSSTFNHDYFDKSRFITWIPISSEMSGHIGMVIVHWGELETTVNKTISAILLAAKRSDQGWETTSFKHRRKLCDDLLIEFIQPYWPNEAELLRKLLHEAGSVYGRRNLIAHGALSFSAPKEALEIKATSRGMSENITVPWLERLWHRLAMINGDWIESVKRFGHVDGLPLIFSCNDLLKIPDGAVDVPISTTGNR